MFRRDRCGSAPLAAMAAALMLSSASTSAQERLPDPTARTTMVAQRVGAPPNPRWVLESTLVASDRRLAVINGETVGVGDAIRGARVVAIEAYGVRLRTGDGMIELSLSGAVDPKRTVGGGF